MKLSADADGRVNVVRTVCIEDRRQFPVHDRNQVKLILAEIKLAQVKAEKLESPAQAKSVSSGQPKHLVVN